MFKIIKKYHFFIISISLIFSNNDKIFYYDLNDKNIFIQELDLAFDNLVTNSESEDDKSIYLMISNENSSSLEWNIKNKSMLRKNSYEDSFNGGNAKDKFEKNIISHVHNDEKNIIELPLNKFEKINQNDELILRNIPIIFSGDKYGYFKLEIAIFNKSNRDKNFINNNFEAINWYKTNIEFIFSKPDIVLAKDYNFNDSELDLPITFSIIENGNLFFNEDREYEVHLDDNLIWSNDFKNIKLISDGQIIDKDKFIVDVQKNKLKIVFNRTVKSSIIKFKDFNIKTENINVPFSKLKLFTQLSPTGKYQNAKSSLRQETENIFMNDSKKSINIENIDIRLGRLESGDFSIINNKENDLLIPNLTINQFNTSNYLRKGDVLNIYIPDDVKLSWGQKINDGNQGHYSLLRVSDKNLRIELEKNFTDILIIKDLFFNKSKNSVDKFKLRVEFNNKLDNYDQIYCEDYISIGHVKIKIEDQAIFTSEFEPIIDELIIDQGRTNSLLAGDEIIIDISNSNSLFFNLEKNIFNKNDLDIKVYDKQINIKIIKESESNSLISLKNIFLERAEESESNIPFKVKFKTGSYPGLRSKYKIDSPKSKISIFDINFDMIETYEIVRDVYNDNSFHMLPSLIIQNTSQNPYVIEQLSINIPDVNYEFLKKRVTLETSIMDKDDIDCYIDGTKKLIKCDFSDEIPISEIITISNIQITVDLEKNNDDLNKLFNLDMLVNDKIISTQSKNSLGIGSPRLRSIDSQSIYSNRESFQPLYQIQVDFQDIPNSVKTIDEILLHIPNRIDLEWGLKSDFANIVTSDNNLTRCNVIFGDTKKDIIIDISDISINQRGKFNIGGLDFINSGSETDDFPLYLSIDNGSNYSAKDDRMKKIINEGNSFDIITKEIQEDLFPIKKGNSLIFLIDKNAPFVWDNEELKNDFIENKKYFNIYKDGSSIKSDAKMLGKHKISENGKTLTFTIMNDLDIQITGTGQMMDYTQILGLRLPIVKNSDYYYNDDKIVKLRLNTMFGDKILRSTDRGITDNKITFKSNQWINPKGTKLRCDIVMGEPDEGFKEPIQRLWYMNPQQLKYIADNCDESIGNSEKMNCLKKGIDNIVKVFREDKDKIYIKQDWLFWYYLGYYKYKWIKELGENIKFPYELFGETTTNLTKKWNKDILESKKHGYGPKYYSNFPEPDAIDNVAFLIITNEIIPELEKQNYQTVYSKLFDGIFVSKKLNNGKKEEIFSKYLLALISDVYFKDINKIRKKSLSDYLLRDIRRTHKKDNIGYNYEQYISQHNIDIVKDYFITDPTDKKLYKQVVDRLVMKPEKIFIEEDSIEKGFVNMTFYHENQSESISNDWRVEITNSNNKGIPVVGYGYYSNTDKVKFNNDIYTFNGSETYDLKFDNLKKEQNGAITLGLSIGTVMLLLLF